MSSSAAPESPQNPTPRPVKHPAPPSPWAGEGQRSLLRPTTLALLFLAMGFVLVMLFPGENYNDPRYTARADGVSVAYLRAILKVRPHDPEPRLVLARQLLSLSILDEALAVLQPMLIGDRVRSLEAELLALDVEERQMFAIPLDKPDGAARRKAALGKVLARMDRLLAARVPAATLERLARISLSVGQPERAANIYLRLARFSKGKREEYLDAAGRWFVAANKNDQAARALREAAIARRDRPKLASVTALRAVDALLAANRPKDALALLEEMRVLLGGGPQLLERGLKLALSVGDMERALTYAMLRAASFPNDLPMQRQLRDLGLARGNTMEALMAAQSIVRLRPDDENERRRLAQIALWSGDLFTSLENWVWLARRGDVPAIDEAIKVGRALLDWERVVEMLTLKAERGGLTREELGELTRAYEALADPQAAAVAVQRWGDQNDRRTWELLASLHNGAGRDQEELAVWREIERRFGARLEDLMRMVELHYRLGQPDEVWRLMREARHLAGPKEIDYWRELAEQAWAREAHSEALLAHRKLWAAGVAEPYEIGRLLMLLGRHGQREELLRVAREAWARSPNPSYLLLAMQTASDAQLFPELESLMGMAESRHAQFRDLEHYWLLRAGLMAWKNRPAEVEEAYRTALVLNPISREARIGWLGFSLERDRRERLAQLVTAWWELALSDPAYARPYAAALDRLGRLQEALPFYDTEARARPRDQAWLESYADALARAGRTDSAHRLRELVLNARRQTAEPVMAAWARRPPQGVFGRPAEAPAAQSEAQAEPVVAYARLLRQLRGDAAAAPVTERLLRAARFDPQVRALAMETELERDNLPGVRRWLWRREDDRALPRPPVALRLALALAENDQETLTTILASESDKVSLSDRITALRQLGRQAAARRLVAQGLMGAPLPGERVALQAHARDLAQAEDDRIAVRALAESFGPLSLLEQEAEYERPAPWSGGRVGFSAGHLRLLPAPGSLLVEPAQSRASLGLQVSHQARRWSGEGRLQLESGAAGALLRGQLEGGLRLPQLGAGSQLRLTLASNEVARDGAVMRTYGKRDRLAAGLDLGLTRYEQVRAAVEIRRDVTHSGAFLARGGGLLLELSHIILTGTPSLRVYAQATAAANQRVGQLPEWLTLRLSPMANLESLLPARYAAFSAGFSLLRGDLSILPLPEPVLSWGLDASAGWLLPAGQMALRGEGTLWWRFLPGHNLGGRLFLSRAQSGRAGETERGLEIRYALAWY